MKSTTYGPCTSIEEVRESANNLDRAELCELQIQQGGIWKDVKNHKGVYNIGQGDMASSVTPYYTVIQHRQYFEAFAEALGRLNISYSMTMKQSGNRAFADIDFIGRDIKFDKLNEEFTTGIRLINSYDKSTGIHMMPRFTRLACTNGMILTRSEKTVGVKHHSKLAREIEGHIEKRLNQIINESADLQLWVASSMSDSIEWKKCCSIIEKLFSQILHREEILKRLKISIIKVTDKKTKKKSITYVLDNKKDRKKKINRWEMYNSITHYLTHGEHITPHIENLFHRQAEKLLITPLKKMPLAVVKI